MPAISSPLRLSANLYVAYSEFPHVDSGNVYLILGKYPTLIDCGSQRAVPQLVRNLAKIGIEVGDLHQVIATHGDCDHTQGFHELRKLAPDLPLLINWNDWPTMLIAGDTYRNSSYLYRRPLVPFVAEQILPLNDGDVLAAGDTTLTVHHTPGHTEGSVCLLGEIDGHGVLFAGDAIGGSMKSLAGADLRLWADAVVTWAASIQRLKALSFDWVLNGHEPAESLPLTRTHVDRLFGSFGMMLNPWFLLGEDEAAAGDVAGSGVVVEPSRSSSWSASDP
ncbi:MAG: MBL fold metallo-hydrolase [Thermomicrobiales bacterium]